MEKLFYTTLEITILYGIYGIVLIPIGYLDPPIHKQAIFFISLASLVFCPFILLVEILFDSEINLLQQQITLLVFAIAITIASYKIKMQIEVLLFYNREQLWSNVVNKFLF